MDVPDDRAIEHLGHGGLASAAGPILRLEADAKPEPGKNAGIDPLGPGLERRLAAERLHDLTAKFARAGDHIGLARHGVHDAPGSAGAGRGKIARVG